MAVVEDAIARRRQGQAPTPVLGQITGANPMSAPPGPVTPPPSSAQVPTQAPAPTSNTQPITPGQETPDETKMILKLLVEKANKLL